MWAGVIVIYFVGFQALNYFLADGLEGLADEIGVNYSILIANFIPMIVIPLMGVGLFMRRDWRQSMLRLGIRPLSLMDFLKSVGISGVVTFGLVVWAIIVGLIWQGLVSEETLREQTEASNALADSITTLGLAFAVAVTAGVGEEIAFRGAMQPVFGFWFTTVIFVAAHTQYALTPAWLIILVVALAFALLRKYFDTTTAIMTHFLYDFTLLILLLVSNEISWLTIPM
jgi:membrane protease YdiL (CAAX protease family)